MTAAFRHVVDIGSGQPVLLLHGWSAHGGFFAPQLALAWKGLRLIVPDLPGHGHDRRPGAVLSIADLADGVADLIAARGLDKVVLVGWSMGAFVAFDYLARHGRDRIAALATIDMTARIVNDADWDKGLTGGIGLEAALATADVMAAQWPAFAERVGPTLFSPDLPRDHPLQQFAATAIAANDGDTLGHLWRSIARADYRAAVKTFDLPALVLAGGLSQLYTPVVSQWLADALPQARRVLLPSAGHAPQVEVPWAVNRALIDFIETAG